MKKNIILKRVTVSLLSMFVGIGFLNKIKPFPRINFVKEPEVYNIAKRSQTYRAYQTGEEELDGYLNFIKRHNKGQKVMGKKEFNAQYWAAISYLRDHPQGKATGDLRKTLIDILKIRELLTGFYKRELTVITRSINRYDSYTEYDLLLKDPEVGRFPVLLLVPSTPKKSYPAIVGLHGHGDSNEVFRDEFFARELVSEGFIVIMPTFRAMDASDTEAIITQELHFNGYTLMGIRVYETLLLIKYLKQMELVSKDGIGVIGHSGGSNVATLTSRITPDIKALVYDINLSPLLLIDKTNFIHCTTIPDLVYYNAQLDDLSGSRTPFLKLEYGYKIQGDCQKIINFFKETLKK